MSASSRFAASEKFAATTAPIPAASTACRSSASRACQPVVPTTRFTPSAASFGAVASVASGVEKSIATSRPWQRSRVIAGAPGVVLDVERPDDLEAVLRRQLLDQPPHPPVTDHQQSHLLLPSGRVPREPR